MLEIGVIFICDLRDNLRHQVSFISCSNTCCIKVFFLFLTSRPTKPLQGSITEKLSKDPRAKIHGSMKTSKPQTIFAASFQHDTHLILILIQSDSLRKKTF